MAKINLTNQHNQENLGTVASLGVLICMVVTIVGIKLWWFKHRLSFEQTSTQNGAAGGGTPPVIVPRRSKQQKYKKDKRYSQQIYDSGEVHGVFRQKREDELEIQRPQQLPPVRICQLSNSTSSLILPPPRNKRRDQVHSTAFEDLEIATPPPLTTASSSDLTVIQESNMKISLTFEEFEKQFKLKEIKSEVSETTIPHEVIEVPVPPSRLNRSSSAMVKPEKTPRYLKSSQSITIPEFNKVIERRPTGFCRPTEDLTKIDDYDEPKLFETFGERRPTGYIKYEEVDVDLQEQYEKDLNADDDYQYSDTENWVNSREVPALEALRNERIIYNNNLNESPDVQYTEKYNFNVKSYKLSELEDVEYKEEDFVEYKTNKTAEIKEISSVTFEELDSENYSNNEEIFNTEYHSVKDRRPTEFVKDSQTNEEELLGEFKTVKERRPTEFTKDLHVDGEEFVNEYRSVKERRATEFAKEPQSNEVEFELCSVKEQRPEREFATEFRLVKERKSPECPNEPQTAQDEFITEFRSVKEKRSTDFAKDSHQEFEEEYVTEFHSVKGHRSTEYVKDPQNNEEYITEYRSINERRPTEFVNDQINGNSEFVESPSLQEDFDSQFTSWPQFEEKIETPKVNVRRFNNQKLESQTNYVEELDFTNTNVKEESSVSFNVSESYEKFTLNQRRPTGFVKNWPESPELSETEEWHETCQSQKKVYSQVRSLMTTESTTYLQQREVTFNSSTVDLANQEDHDNSAIKQRRPTGFVGKDDDYYVTFNDESDEDENENLPSKQRHVEVVEIAQPKVKFDDHEFSTWGQSETEKFTLDQRRPTGFIRSTNNEELWQEISNDSEDFPKSQVKFDKSTDFKDEQEIWDSEIKQRRPTGYVRKLEMLELSDDESLPFKERRPTGFNRDINFEDEEYTKNDFENKEIPISPTVRFKEMEYGFSDSENNSESLLKQRRPTGFVRKEEIDKLEKQVNFQLNDEETETFSKENEALRQRRPTGFVRKEEINKQVNFQINLNSEEEEKTEYGNEQLRQRRPTGFVKKDLTFLENPPPLYQTTNNDGNNDFDDHLWQEMEKDVEKDFSNNIEEEFSKIRHSYEIHEADFLEKSPLNSPQQPLGFGKSIEDDWVNFEKLKSQQIAQANLQSPQEIKITFSDTELTATTTSILKEHKLEEDIQVKPRKSKVTFDFKTEEHVIPARKAHSDLEFESDYDDDDVYDKPPPPIPPQPMQRMSNINYNTETNLTPIVTVPKTISLFGSQISQDDNEDSWLAIRKHRNLTVELHNVTNTDSELFSPPPVFNTPPPKPAYRNPMAQLAIQRAKEVRADMDGFKARSINDKKPEASKRQKQKVLDLNNDDYEGTDA